VSTHRAERHRATKAVEEIPGHDPAAPSPGRRKTLPAPRRSGRVMSTSMIGGLVLLVAAVGVVTAGQAISAGQDVTPTSSQQHGSYVASMSSTSLAGRDATMVSRGVTRPVLAGRFKAKGSAATTSAQLLANERNDKLRDAAAEAENYAEELSSDEWVLPTSGFHISTWFGEAGPYWSSGYHTGVDFATAYGTPAVAVTNAVVVQTGWDGPYGNQVRLQLENGDEVWYNHLSSIDVVTGQQVVKGQQVGRVGETGNAYGAHLHFEYRLASNLHDGVDPVPFFLEHNLTL
jgi:murein DD-endopeptidase MepM/ murein hydrolase activator NlpD